MSGPFFFVPTGYSSACAENPNGVIGGIADVRRQNFRLVFDDPGARIAASPLNIWDQIACATQTESEYLHGEPQCD